MSQIQDFEARIDIFLSNLLHPPTQKKYGYKIIHDSIWGTNKFFPWEVGVIDSPLLQRLRRIHQTGLANLVYPTANHTRFDHSLGVTILADKLANHLNDNVGNIVVNKRQKYELRLAAILHDVGHSFFSHVSELVYERLREYQDLREEINIKFGVKPKGHEIFSFLIVKSKVFQTYFDTIIKTLSTTDKRKIDGICWDTIAGYIIGFVENPNNKYLADVINGPMDCDKLDYLARDAKFAGPIIAYDLDRLLYTANIATIADRIKRLTVTLSGVNVIEQLIISKMMMFSYVYHHHKLRAIEAMIKRLCFDIIDDKCTTEPAIILKHPVDFLNYTDDCFITSYVSYLNNSGIVKETIMSLINRNLWIRGMIISCFNSNTDKLPPELTQLERNLHIKKNIDYLKNLKLEIVDEVRNATGKQLSDRDIWIDFPFAPPDNEPKHIEVKKRNDLEDYGIYKKFL